MVFTLFLIIVLAWLSWWGYHRLVERSEVQQQRLETMELELARLRRELGVIRQPTRPEMAAAEASGPESVAPLATEEPVQPVPPPPESEVPEVEEAAVPEAAAPAPDMPPVPEMPPLPVGPPAPQPPAPEPRGPAIEWEQWIGVRGAAVLGGIVLAVAGFFFLRYSIEAGWLQPPVRVALGIFSGVGALVGAEVLRRRGYEPAANGIAGAGVVLLYAAVFAAYSLYHLIGFVTAFAVMALVTVTCGIVSWRYHSLVVAVLGLVGGYAAPLLLASGHSNPIGLFSYLLLLNAGLTLLARRCGWPGLGPLALVATIVYQALWIFFDMGPRDQILGLVILGVFSLFFVLVARPSLLRTTGEEEPARATGPGLWTQIAALVSPFVFAVYFAANSNLGEHLYPIAALLLLLGCGAAWLARVHRLPLLEEAVAVATVAVAAVWWIQVDMTTSLSWEGVLVMLGLAATFHVPLELTRWRSAAGGPIPARPRGAAVVASGLLLWLVLASPFNTPVSFWAVLVGWLGLATLLARQSSLVGSYRRHRLAAVVLAFGSFYLGLAAGWHESLFAGMPDAGGVVAVAIGLALAGQLFALTQRGSASAPAELSAALPPLGALLGMLALAQQDALFVHGASLLLALLAVLCATRRSSGVLYLVTVILLAWVQTSWADSHPALGSETALPAQFATVLLLTAWPFAVRARLRSPLALRAAALVAPLWFLSLRELWTEAVGTGSIGLLAVLLGAVSLASALASRRLLVSEPGRERIAIVWFSAIALGFVCLAIPLQLDREWITLGWALEGLAVMLLWRRLDHPGLKYFGLALLAAVTVRLAINPELLRYHPKSAWPILNWIAYTYLVPAAALLGTARVLQPLEVGRQRPWERALYRREWPVGAAGCALAAIAVVFVWINMTILDAFATGPALSITWERLPARDLTLSIAWAIYALVLLALGVARESGGLRWISLTVLVLTIGKVFLYDLGELQDLYRVASLVGLAVSLILVSLLYQRFVFRRPRATQPR